MKQLLIALALSLAVNLAALYINYQTFEETNYLAWSIRHDGGEITVEYGFGLHAVHTYGMTPDQPTTHDLRFAPVNLALCVLAGTAIAYGAAYIFAKIICAV